MSRSVRIEGHEALVIQPAVPSEHCHGQSASRVVYSGVFRPWRIVHSRRALAAPTHHETQPSSQNQVDKISILQRNRLVLNLVLLLMGVALANLAMSLPTCCRPAGDAFEAMNTAAMCGLLSWRGMCAIRSKCSAMGSNNQRENKQWLPRRRFLLLWSNLLRPRPITPSTPWNCQNTQP